MKQKLLLKKHIGWKDRVRICSRRGWYEILFESIFLRRKQTTAMFDAFIYC